MLSSEICFIKAIVALFGLLDDWMLNVLVPNGDQIVDKLLSVGGVNVSVPAIESRWPVHGQR